MNKLLIAAIAILALPAFAMAEISSNDVAEKMKAGDVKTAEFLTKQILEQHPNSAKAHYYMGQILATEGNYKGGYKELNKAADLDRSLSFASSPDKFREEMDKVKVNLGDAPAQAISNEQESSSHLGLILLLLIAGGGAVYWFFIRTKPEPEEEKKETYKPTPPSPPSSPSAAQTSYQTAPKQAPASGSTYRTYTPSYPQPHITNNYNSGNDGLLTGVLLGSMMSERGNHTVVDRETIIERNTTNNTIQNNNFDSGSSNSSDNSSFNSGSTPKNDFDSGSNDSSSFDSGSSSFDSGSSSFDSGSSGGDSSW